MTASDVRANEWLYNKGTCGTQVELARLNELFIETRVPQALL